MQENEYMARVLETESKPEHLAINTVSLDILLAVGAAAGQVMNRAKRAMFYQKPLEKAEMLAALEELIGTAELLGMIVSRDQMQGDQVIAGIAKNPEVVEFLKVAQVGFVNKRLLHGAIGEMSETAEKLEALRDQLGGNPLDIVNYAEELGDSAWYNAIQTHELNKLANDPKAAGTVPEDFSASTHAIRARNIAKLEKRNKGRVFNAEATVNRDTEAERAILESAVAFVAGTDRDIDLKADREQQEAAV